MEGDAGRLFSVCVWQLAGYRLRIAMSGADCRADEAHDISHRPVTLHLLLSSTAPLIISSLVSHYHVTHLQKPFALTYRCLFGHKHGHTKLKCLPVRT